MILGENSPAAAISIRGQRESPSAAPSAYMERPAQSSVSQTVGANARAGETSQKSACSGSRYCDCGLVNAGDPLRDCDCQSGIPLPAWSESQSACLSL